MLKEYSLINRAKHIMVPKLVQDIFASFLKVKTRQKDF